MLLLDEILNIIKEKGLVKESNLELLNENNPKENDSLADLIYKLSCTTNQMWYNQDILYKIRFMSTEEFIKTYNCSLDELHNIIKRACDLNVQRANLMDAIDLKVLSIKRG